MCLFWRLAREVMGRGLLLLLLLCLRADGFGPSQTSQSSVVAGHVDVTQVDGFGCLRHLACANKCWVGEVERGGFKGFLFHIFVLVRDGGWSGCVCVGVVPALFATHVTRYPSLRTRARKLLGTIDRPANQPIERLKREKKQRERTNTPNEICTFTLWHVYVA